MSMTGQRNRVSNFYQVGLGKIRKNLGKEAPEIMEGVTERINKNGETVYEIVSDYIAGKIVAANLEEPEKGKEDFGKRVALTLESETGEKANLYFKWDSAYGRGFIFAAPNVDLSVPVEFEPYQYKQKGTDKTKTGLSLIQEGVQLDWAFGTKANPGGCPPLEKVVFKGETKWDNTKQLKFLEDQFAKFAAPVNSAAETEEAPEEVPQGVEDDDDMF